MLFTLVVVVTCLVTLSEAVGHSDVWSLAQFGLKGRGHWNDLHRRDYPAGLSSKSCSDRSCCRDNLQSLNAECFVVIPFLTSLITYFLAYAYGITSSSSNTVISIGTSGSTSTTIVRTLSVTCSTTVTTSVSSVAVQFTTVTGTVTITQEATSVVSTMITTTVYTPLLSVSTSLITSTLTTTPTSFSISTVTMPSYYVSTYIDCMKNPGRRSVKDLELGKVGDSGKKRREMRFVPVTEKELQELINQTSTLEPSY